MNKSIAPIQIHKLTHHNQSDAGELQFDNSSPHKCQQLEWIKYFPLTGPDVSSRATR